MVIIKLKRDQRGHYFFDRFEPKVSLLLGLFLTDDVGSRISGWVGDL